MRKSNWILIVGLVVLLVGAGMSIADIEPYADYVLIAGALIVIARGVVRTHENSVSGHSRFAEKIAEKMFPNKDEDKGEKNN